MPCSIWSPLTIGIYLYDVGDEQGPLASISGSHKGELFNQYDQYDARDQWVNCISDEDAGRIDTSNTQYLTGPAGSITIHNCRLVHPSRPNLSDRGRPLLLNAHSSADAFTYTANPLPSQHEGTIVRGKPARWAHHDGPPCLVPPDWGGGYTSLYALQKQAEWDEDQLAEVAKQTAQIRTDEWSFSVEALSQLARETMPEPSRG